MLQQEQVFLLMFMHMKASLRKQWPGISEMRNRRQYNPTCLVSASGSLSGCSVV